MTYVITQGCCADAACTAVCPVQCIRPRPGDPDFTTAEQLYIDPATCIDCGACVPECPVDAIRADYDVEPEYEDYFAINEAYFAGNPILEEDPPPVQRRRLPEHQPELRVAVIGTGPAGGYAAAELAAVPGVAVTMIDRLPTPYGLVRSGVAADHPKTKMAGDQFRSLLSRRNVTCLLNVTVGRDVSVDELLRSHHAVIHAYGTADDRRLAIRGEDLPGSVAARSFVAWSNGHPDHTDDPIDLSGERAVIIGNGNVALDVARFLARPAGDFAATDVAGHALEALKNSTIGEVVIAARRGPADAAFTSTEILALSRLDGVDLLATDVEIGPEPDADPVAQRKHAVVAAAATRVPNRQNRRIVLRFGLTPTSINGDDHVSSVTFQHRDGSSETIDTALVIRAIGYRGTALEGVPFDERTATIPHDRGRVIAPDTGQPVIGHYCVGWIKRGPSGFIGTNRSCSTETVDALWDDIRAVPLPPPVDAVEDLRQMLASRGVDVVDHAGWQRINQAELTAGKVAGRSRVKFVSVDQLLSASRT